MQAFGFPPNSNCPPATRASRLSAWRRGALVSATASALCLFGFTGIASATTSSPVATPIDVVSGSGSGTATSTPSASPPHGKHTDEHANEHANHKVHGHGTRNQVSSDNLGLRWS